MRAERTRKVKRKMTKKALDDCIRDLVACTCCDGLLPSHVEATVAGVNAVATALREPTEDEIPRDKRGSFVERLGSACELAQMVREELTRAGYSRTADAMRMIIEKVGGVARDIALAEGKGE